MGLRSFFYRGERWFILLYLACLAVLFGAFFFWLFNNRGSYTLERFLIERYQKPWRERYAGARRRWDAGELATAEAAYERFLAEIPADQIRLRLAPLKVKAYRDLGAIYLQRGKPRRALDIFNELVSFDPRNYFSYYYLASCHVARGETDEAVSALEEALRINPNYQQAFEEIVGVLHGAGMYAEAIRRHEEYMKALCVIQGAVYFSSGDKFSRERRVPIENILVNGEHHTYTMPLYGVDAWRSLSSVKGLRLSFRRENPGMTSIVVRVDEIKVLRPSRAGTDGDRGVVSFSGDFTGWEPSQNVVFVSPDTIVAEGERMAITTTVAIDPGAVDAIEVSLAAYKPVSWETILAIGDCYRQLALLDDEKGFFMKMREQFPHKSMDAFTPQFLLREQEGGKIGGVAAP